MLNPVGRWCRGRVASVVHPSPRRGGPAHSRFRTGCRTCPASTTSSGCGPRTATPRTRSYSLASAPDEPALEFYVERLADGEVSPYLAEAVEVGDELELRGPIGGWFVWDGRTPAVGIARRHRRRAADLDGAARPGTRRERHVAPGGVVARPAGRAPVRRRAAAYQATIALSRERTCAGRARRTAQLPRRSRRYVDRDGTYFICGSAGFAECGERAADESRRTARSGPGRAVRPAAPEPGSLEPDHPGHQLTRPCRDPRGTSRTRRRSRPRWACGTLRRRQRVVLLLQGGHQFLHLRRAGHLLGDVVHRLAPTPSPAARSARPARSPGSATG